MTRDQMQSDVVIVGAGPSGLAAACRLKQLNKDLSVCLLEKGAEIGSHILSGAVFEPKALNELFPNWANENAPLLTTVQQEEWHYLTTSTKSICFPNSLLPNTLHNNGNYVISLGKLCQWLGERATDLGVDIFPCFTAHELLFDTNNNIIGVITGDMGRAADGSEKPEFTQGIELIGKYTLFCEGARGHLGKKVIQHYALDADKDPQHYGIGIKEIWKISKEKHQPGKVFHSFGWPLSETNSTGGGFLYHLEDNKVAVGLITDLAYSNPHLSPFDEFQRYKLHPQIANVLEGGERLAYGARAIAKGGLQSQPKMTFAGGLLLGDDAGTLNFAKIKGSHTAMKSGMIAAEVVAEALAQNREQDELIDYAERYKSSWAYQELHEQRNIGPAQHKLGAFWGAAWGFIELHCKGKLPWTLHNSVPDHAKLLHKDTCVAPKYPKPDGKLTFDKLSSVYLTNTFHEENQPCHLVLKDRAIPLGENLAKFDEPAQRYCPAGVYEIVPQQEGSSHFQINAQNCIHCKTCDIKDPSQNITWVTPEGSGGPQYQGM